MVGERAHPPDGKELIVKEGYDRIGKKYQDTRTSVNNAMELARFAGLLPPKGRVLDAGCGTGLPVAKFMVEAGFGVTGVDFSGEMLTLARKNVLGARFIRQNLTELKLPDRSFHGIISLYVIIHIPREKHAALLQCFHRLLRPGGILMVTMGCDEWEDEGEFCGERMFWSQYGPGESLRIVRESGFEVIDDWFDSPRDWFSKDERHY
jgi:ubiquinone/menaquinone biosynthesis C-methylase UbiE